MIGTMNNPSCFEVFKSSRVRARKVLQLECGVTQVSLENAFLLFKQYGVPEKVELVRDNNEYAVLVFWHSYTHLFIGFSWGYSGEGPRGLDILMSACWYPHITSFSAERVWCVCPRKVIFEKK